MINTQVQCPVLLCVWLQFELVCDDLRNTVLMLPPSISHYCIEGEVWERESWQMLWRWPPWMWRWWSESESCERRREI